MKYFYSHIYMNWSKFLLFLVAICLTSHLTAASDSITIGVYENPPKVYTNEAGEVCGVFIDILKEIAKNEGWQLKYVHDSWDHCLQFLEDGSIDIMPDIAFTYKRDEIYDFNRVKVLESSSQIYTRPGLRIKELVDLKNKRIAFVSRTIQDKEFDKLMNGYGYEYIKIPCVSYQDVFSLTSKGEADVAITNYYFGQTNYKAFNLKKTPLVFNVTSLYYAVTNGMNTSILNTIDKYLTEWKNEKESFYYQLIYDYFETPFYMSNLGSNIFIYIFVTVFGIFFIMIIIFLLRKLFVYTKNLRASNTLLKLEEGKFKSYIEHAPFGIFVTDDKGNYIDVNPAACQITAYNRDELLCLSISDLIPKRSHTTAHKHLQRIAREGKASAIMPFVTKNGELRYWEVDSVQLTHTLFLGFAHDITERRQSEKKIEEALELATESDRLKSAFLANMSHEIRTPMNGILGFTSLLQNPDLTDETRDKYIQIIRKSGDRMLDTVNDLIIISKLETGQEKLNLLKGNPCKLVQEMFEFFKPSAISKGLDFKYIHHCSNTSEIAYLDVTKFNSIVGNLIKNAIKYTDNGEIIIRSEKDDKNIIISVEDTGYGIPKDRQDAIFDRFVQADIKDSQALQGSGLGLSIVKAYVEMMHGTISLESELGKGSCFTAKLPLKKIEREKLNLSKKDIVPSKIKLNKILIAEDDVNSFQYLSISLEPYTDKILHAANGQEAVQMARDNMDCDLILMDIKMPVMNGHEAVKRIREFNKSVQIISQTAYAMQEDKEKSLAAGCNDYISKPIDINKLLSMIGNNV